MVTLQETTAKFNNNLHVSHTGGRLSSDSGLALVDECSYGRFSFYRAF